jgi:hypothetical protein
MGYVAHTGERRKIVVGKPEGKRALRRHSHRWEDNIIMHLVQNIDQWQALVNTITKLWVP